LNPRKERAAKGLCPECGAEAAPYYLCGTCRMARKLGAILRAGVRDGLVETVPDDGHDRRKRYRLRPEARGLSEREINERWRYRETDPGDRRNLPRLRGVPVDVERELANMLASSGRGLTIEEIREAWVRLRPRKGRPAATAMAAMIRAEDKRARRRARNARLATAG
jgi:DNA-binding MarR family transcriptional regulator